MGMDLKRIIAMSIKKSIFRIITPFIRRLSCYEEAKLYAVMRKLGFFSHDGIFIVN